MTGPELKAKELWRHPDPQSTRMHAFLQHINSTYNLRLDDYASLYKWSIDNVPDFWGEVWSFTGIKAEKTFDGEVSMILFTCIRLSGPSGPQPVGSRPFLT